MILMTEIGTLILLKYCGRWRHSAQDF